MEAFRRNIGKRYSSILICDVFVQAQKNVLLEERIQVLQQQNEDLKDRIDRNLAMSRSL